MSEKGGPVAVGLFQRLFGAHPSQVALLDLSGRIVAVNEAWHRFGRENGLRSGYRVTGIDYVDVCARAVREGAPYAQEALTGVVALLSGAQRSFTLRYPCHSPQERRWFKLYGELQTPESPSIIIAHTYLGPARPREAADPLGFPSGTNWDSPFPHAWNN
jgi:hypothetical protein